MDMRSRAPLFALLFVVSSLALPLAAHAGGIPFFGPIIPNEQITINGVVGNQNVCAAGWGMLVTVINNIISLLLTLAIVFVAPLMIAYSGFLFVINPVNAGGKEKAKEVLLNTVAGIVIALSAWMIVGAIMAVLYHPTGSVGSTWSSLITGGGDICIPLAGSLNQAVQTGIPTSGISGSGSLGAPPPGKANTACDPAAVQAAATTGGYTLTSAQANTLACIASPESSCGKTLINYKWNSGSSAVGAFQVLLQKNTSCYENSACYTAAGLPTSGSKLNCASGFSGGNPKPGSSVASMCVQAASNLNCSASAAACLLQQNGGSFSPWQADVNSAKQTGCITGTGA